MFSLTTAKQNNPTYNNTKNKNTMMELWMYNWNELGADVVRVNIFALPIFEELGVSPGMSESDWHVKSPGISYYSQEERLRESRKISTQPFNSQDLKSNSLYCLTYSSYDVNLENLALDQLIIP